MKDWKSHIDLSPPYWQDYRHFLSRLDGREFPDTQSLNRLLPGKLVNRKGAAVQFLPARQLADVPYEKHIYESGEISTRENNWHDLFNALVWCRLPRLKLAMNTLHARHMGPEDTESRGKVRDALTLFDECGAIVFSSDRNRIASLADRDWKTVFEPDSRSPDGQLQLVLTGHALLEKFLHPYKSITAHVLLLQVDRDWAQQPRELILSDLDESLATLLVSEQLFLEPADLSPLPLMGLPGWWQECAQDDAFYADRSVFRPPPGEFRPAPVFTL